MADPAGRAGYVRKPGGGVEAIDLSSGKPRWDAPQLLRPLIASDKELAGLSTFAPATSTSRVLFLDGKNGKQRVASQPLVFPEWVTIDGLSTVAWLDGDQLLLRWEAHRKKPGGPLPSETALRNSLHDASGGFRVTWSTGAVTVDDALAAPPAAKEIELEVKAGRLWLRGVDVGAAPEAASEPLRPALIGKRLLYVVGEEPEMNPVNEGALFRPRTLDAVAVPGGKLLWQRQLAGRYVPPPRTP